ncbi:hypothetical protein [Streptomyces sp. R08]|uniref:Uncharacterized protein n=1 Tax=Streptomyces sp. R08 TaxID=3238624 RepID=A0AB39MDT8_9ACTN
MVWTGLAAAACALVAVSGVVATGISLRWWEGSPATGDASTAAALVLIVLGCVLQWRAQRPAPR